MRSYAEFWKDLEEKSPRPNRFKGVCKMPFEQLAQMVLDDPLITQEMICRALYDGYVYVLQGGFTLDFLRRLRNDTILFMRSQPSSFHKMLEGSPDFHRMITLEDGLKYAFPCCKHSAYFYRWNDDPLNILPTITARWSVVKMLMGLSPDEFERNTPKDGVVDRVQVVRYPPKIGFLATHADPYLHQRLFLSGIMSKRGVNFVGGGFYMIGETGPMELEDHFEVGDIVIGYATVHHGVTACDGVADWNGTDGRWFLSMYSNATDVVKDRHTGKAV